MILSGPGTRHAYEYLGDAVRAGKYVMYSWMRMREIDGELAYNPDQARYTLQAYHLFGDPMLRIRRPEPPSDAH